MENSIDFVATRTRHVSQTLITETPLLEVMPGILAKFECNNPGGSHKVRAARYIVEAAIREGAIVPGKTTVIEKTGGSFGFGLTVACAEIGVPVELAVGLGFSQKKRLCLEAFGARLIGIDMLKAGKTPREVVEWHLAHSGALGKSYYYTDQFNNPGSVKAHESDTGPEIVNQLRFIPGLRDISFVACAGTGASIVGISNCLRAAGYNLRVILVEPAGCDSREGQFIEHKFEGMAVGVTPPFLNYEMIDDTISVNHEDMLKAQRQLAKNKGYFIGNTSAACLCAAMAQVRCSSPQHKVLTMFYDHALWYL